LQVVVMIYDIHLCFFFIAFALFPCQGLFMNGLGVYLGMSAHVTLVVNLTILSAMCAWYTCCLFQRHQHTLPRDHPYKLSEMKILLVYALMNFVMIINPLLLAVTIRDDSHNQRDLLRQSYMAWLLKTPSFKIYTDDNSPLLGPLHFPLTVITFALNTGCSIFFTIHSSRVLKSR
ncbi:hypothetical protein PFISCL1PPCAC_16028, partial [Pristionchus fissidentatus]